MYRTIGRGFARTFLIPYSKKFWRTCPSELTFEWTGGRVPVPSTWQVLRGALYSRQSVKLGWRTLRPGGQHFGISIDAVVFGRETVRYVRDIYKYYVAYKLAAEGRAAREAAKPEELGASTR